MKTKIKKAMYGTAMKPSMKSGGKVKKYDDGGPTGFEKRQAKKVAKAQTRAKVAGIEGEGSVKDKRDNRANRIATGVQTAIGTGRSKVPKSTTYTEGSTTTSNTDNRNSGNTSNITNSGSNSAGGGGGQSRSSSGSDASKSTSVNQSATQNRINNTSVKQSQNNSRTNNTKVSQNQNNSTNVDRSNNRSSSKSSYKTVNTVNKPVINSNNKVNTKTTKMKYGGTAKAKMTIKKKK